MKQTVQRLLDAGVMQQSLAARIGVSKSKLKRWLDGERPQPFRVDVLERFQDYIDHLEEIVVAAKRSMPRAPLPERKTAAKTRAS